MPIQRRHLFVCALPFPTACSLQRLPELERQAIAPPATAPTLRPPTVGQTWSYRQLNGFNSAQVGTLEERRASGAGWVIQRRDGLGRVLAAERHAQYWGDVIEDPGWDVPLLLETPLPWWPQGTAASKGWVRTHYREPGGSFRYALQFECRVLGWDRVQVPAGTFAAVSIERRFRLQHPDPTRLDTQRLERLWLAPEVGRWVARETTGQYIIPSGDRRGDVYLEDHFRWELTAWSAG